jgi:hypothetical protein
MGTIKLFFLLLLIIIITIFIALILGPIYNNWGTVSGYFSLVGLIILIIFYIMVIIYILYDNYTTNVIADKIYYQSLLEKDEKKEV